MPFTQIRLGSNPNDGTGDSLHAAGEKLNAMLAELYGQAAPVQSVAGLTGAIAGSALKIALAIAAGDIVDSGATGRALLQAADAATAKAALSLVKADVGLGLVDNVSVNALLGANNGIATLDAGGKVPTAQLPALAITDTFPVASQAAMLALTAQRGDVAIRSDLNKSFILGDDDPTQLANWSELLTPTDAVLSVAGLTGAIAGSALKTALSLAQADIAGLTMTSAPTFAGLTLTGPVIVNFNTAPPASGAHTDSIHLSGADNQHSQILLDSYGQPGGTVPARSVIDLRAARGTAAAPSATLLGDEIARLSGRGYDDTGFTGSVASVSVIAAEDFTGTNQGSFLGFRSTALGTVGGGSLNIPPLTAAITPAGGLVVGPSFFSYANYPKQELLSEPGAGVIDVAVGYKVNSAAAAGNVLRGNGTVFVGAQLGLTDLAFSSGQGLQLSGATGTNTKIEFGVGTGTNSQYITLFNDTSLSGTLRARNNQGSNTTLNNIPNSFTLINNGLSGGFVIGSVTGPIFFAYGGTAYSNQSMQIGAGVMIGDHAFGATDPGAGFLSIQNGLTVNGATVKMTAIPTVDPHVVGQIWANAGVLTVSAG